MARLACDHQYCTGVCGVEPTHTLKNFLDMHSPALPYGSDDDQRPASVLPKTPSSSFQQKGGARSAPQQQPERNNFWHLFCPKPIGGSIGPDPIDNDPNEACPAENVCTLYCKKETCPWLVDAAHIYNSRLFYGRREFGIKYSYTVQTCAKCADVWIYNTYAHGCSGVE